MRLRTLHLRPTRRMPRGGACLLLLALLPALSAASSRALSQWNIQQADTFSVFWGPDSLQQWGEGKPSPGGKGGRRPCSRWRAPRGPRRRRVRAPAPSGAPPAPRAGGSNASAAGFFLLAPGAVSLGTVVLDGQANIQPNATACAAACASNAGCSTFNYCSKARLGWPSGC